ncbi:MAG: two-component system response regulator [Acidobacteria bacterium]|nr:two-component system response regulator [Acidobacteriota bacterium]
MSLNLYRTEPPNQFAVPVSTSVEDHVVLVVSDHQDLGAELRQVLKLSGYRVIDTDNGQDAAKRAQYEHPNLLLVDLDVPLLYEIVAARQILKNAKLEIMPVVIVTHDEALDPAPMLEVGVRRNEYITRMPDYQHLEQLLDYLLPVKYATRIQPRA